MRAHPWLLALTLATTWGCGDGIGQPILGDGRPAAGAGGLGGTGAAGGTSGGGGSTGGISAAAGAAGTSGNPPLGGSAGSDRERPPPGGGLAPPGEEGIGGWGGSRPGGGGYSGMPSSDGVPAGSYCAEVADWHPDPVGAEWVIYEHLNAARWVGFTCGTDPLSTPPSGERVDPVRMDPALRCAARLNSKALSEGRDLGVGPEDRMRDAGAMFRVASESVDRLPPPSDPEMPPYDPILAIFDAGGSRCDNLMDQRFDSVGIGVYRDFVTLDFTGP